MTATRRAQSLSNWLMCAPAATWLLSAGVVLFALIAAQTDRYLHDEGLLTWYFAQMPAAEPAALIFLQKSRPLLGLIYAPLATLGLGRWGFTVVHSLVAVSALPLLAATARSLNIKAANLAPALLASSALWLACGPAGVSNSDAVTGLALVLYLWIVRERPLAAGLLLGALLFARSEVALFALGLGTFALFRARGSRRLALAIPVVPAIYILAGALYHHDLLWALHFPPALPTPPPETPRFGEHGYGAGLGDTLLALLSLMPALLLLPAARLLRGKRKSKNNSKSRTERKSRAEIHLRLFAALALAYVAAIRGLPALGIFNFDDSPRYLLPTLPFAALALAHLCEEWQGPALGRKLTALLALWLGLAFLAEPGAGPTPLVACAGLLTLLALARSGHPRLASLGLVLASATALPALEPVTRMRLADNDPDLPALTTWLKEHPEPRSRPIVTNMPVLKTWLSRQGVSTGPLYYLLGADQDYEIERLSNAAVGQREALRKGLDTTFYGLPLRPPRTPTDAPAPPRLFILSADDRLDGSLPPEEWRGQLDNLATLGRIRLVVDTQGQGDTVPPGLPPTTHPTGEDAGATIDE
ncbi:MAG TPA: hypothetical protein ENJ18_12405 [Nannocystis exedens]|nr:hypothetical protein [Nannocystis exedens]